MFFLCPAWRAVYCITVFRYACRAPVYNVRVVDVCRHVSVAPPVVAPGACVAQDQFASFIADVTHIVVVSFVFFPFCLLLFLFYCIFYTFLFLICGFPCICDF